MKKMKKLAQMLLALVMVLGLALPAQALEIPEFQPPESFDFTVDFTLSLDLLEDPAVEPIMDMIFGGPEVAVHVTGTVVNTSETAAQMYVEVLLGAGILGASPVRMWTDVDVTDLTAPTMLYIVELPAALRLMLAMQNRELGRQFLVLDLGETIAEEMADFNFPTESEMEAFMEEMLAELEDFDFASVWEQVVEFIDVVEFNFDWFQDEDGFFAGLTLALSAVLDPAGEAVAFATRLDVEITNINNASIAFPVLTDTNSVDLLSL